MAADSAPAVMVRETLARALRLTYFTNLSKSVPRKLESLLPPEPQFTSLEGVSKECVGTMETALNAIDVAEASLMTALQNLQTPTPPPVYQLDVLMGAVLHGGRRSIMTTATLLERAAGALAQLQVEEKKSRIVGHVFAFWRDNTQVESRQKEHCCV